MNNELRITINSALYQYIRRYADELKITPHKACLKVMAGTEKVLNLILYGDTETMMKVA